MIHNQKVEKLKTASSPDLGGECIGGWRGRGHHWNPRSVHILRCCFFSSHTAILLFYAIYVHIRDFAFYAIQVIACVNFTWKVNVICWVSAERTSRRNGRRKKEKRHILLIILMIIPQRREPTQHRGKRSVPGNYSRRRSVMCYSPTTKGA